MDIKVDHVSKAYGEQQILRDLCCVFPEGKTTCIRGRSGCGKNYTDTASFGAGYSG